MVLIFLVLFLAVAGVLVMVTVTETRIAGAERASHAVRGAAEVALERALQELALAPDWNAVLNGATQSGFIDPAGPSPVAGWGTLDMSALTTRLQRETDGSNGWGADGPRWRLFGFGPFGSLIGDALGDIPAIGDASAGNPAIYTAMWVADDEGEGDGNPAADSNGTVTVRAEAFGPYRSRQALLATVRRRGGGLEVLSWRAPDTS